MNVTKSLLRGALATVIAAATAMALGTAGNTANASTSTRAREGVNPFTGEKMAAGGCVAAPNPSADSAWSMTVTDGNIGLAQPGSNTVLNLSTASVLRGSIPVDLTVTKTTGDGTAAITTRTGLVEVAESAPNGVDQAWCFPKPLDGTGDLAVRVAATATVNGASVDLTATATADGITLQTPRGATANYDNGLWVDATGHVTPVAARYANGAIQLTVPAAVLAATTFPAALDPQVVP